jgi:hypothetical protein
VLGLIAAQLLTLTQTTFNMNKILSALALVALALPAGATPTVREVVNPNEAMVVVPGLEFLGASRVSTVEFCAEINEVQDWQNAITDADLLNLEACLIEMT